MTDYIQGLIDTDGNGNGLPFKMVISNKETRFTPVNTMLVRSWTTMKDGNIVRNHKFSNPGWGIECIVEVEMDDQNGD